MIFTQDGTLLCWCGNTPGSSGFDPCTATGTIDYTLLDANSPPGLHYVCNRCGLIGPTE